MRSMLKSCLVVVAVVWLARMLLLTSFSIPSEGMENTLLRGDRVLVNRWSYGFRLPLSQWLGALRWGNGRVEQGEIVLFNNPTPRQGGAWGSEVFVGRCVALPGDSLTLNSELLPVEAGALSPNRKGLFAYPMEREEQLKGALAHFGWTDNGPVGYDEGRYWRSLSAYEVYLLKQWLHEGFPLEPLQAGEPEELHTLVVPARGLSVRVDAWNVKLLCNLINRFEGRHALVRDDRLWVDGKRVTAFRFSKDYYWMTSDNSMSLCDSRLFGPVPKDCLIGRVTLVWLSKDPLRPWYAGWRWNRCFRAVH